jgi:hypothetical protein
LRAAEALVNRIYGKPEQPLGRAKRAELGELCGPRFAGGEGDF